MLGDKLINTNSQLLTEVLGQRQLNLNLSCKFIIFNYQNAIENDLCDLT